MGFEALLHGGEYVVERHHSRVCQGFPQGLVNELDVSHVKKLEEEIYSGAHPPHTAPTQS